MLKQYVQDKIIPHIRRILWKSIHAWYFPCKKSSKISKELIRNR